MFKIFLFLFSTTIFSLDLQLTTAQELCWIVSSPGDIILRRALYEGNDFDEKTLKLIKLNELLKRADLKLDYRHAEIATRMDTPFNIESISYYPGQYEGDSSFVQMNSKKAEYSFYRSKFAIFSIKDKTPKIELKRKEMAIYKVTKWKDQFSQFGTCADFVNWAFSGIFKSKWNKIPFLQDLIQILYPPELIKTPDDIADASRTKMSCWVENGDIKYPQKIDSINLIKKLKRESSSHNSSISSHAKEVLIFLQDQQILDYKQNLISSEEIVPLLW